MLRVFGCLCLCVSMCLCIRANVYACIRAYVNVCMFHLVSGQSRQFSQFGLFLGSGSGLNRRR